eukprot:1534574-Amphidinium_carterae.1
MSSTPSGATVLRKTAVLLMQLSLKSSMARNFGCCCRAARQLNKLHALLDAKPPSRHPMLTVLVTHLLHG